MKEPYLVGRYYKIKPVDDWVYTPNSIHWLDEMFKYAGKTFKCPEYHGDFPRVFNYLWHNDWVEPADTFMKRYIDGP